MAEFQMRPVECPVRLDGLSPVEVAGQLRHLDGLVFFDTAGNFPNGASRPFSVIAASPVRVLRGNIHHADDQQSLRTALAESPPHTGDRGFPVGGLCGWISYEGDFVLGDYPEMLVFSHHDQTW